GASQSKVLKYANSGDVSGDRSGVVGYISCVFMVNNQKKTGK
ncbi:MAG: AmmeMemoRadiSam system protein B, partial [Syntrophorhabdus sp.]